MEIKQTMLSFLQFNLRDTGFSTCYQPWWVLRIQGFSHILKNTGVSCGQAAKDSLKVDICNIPSEREITILLARKSDPFYSHSMVLSSINTFKVGRFEFLAPVKESPSDLQFCYFMGKMSGYGFCSSSSLAPATHLYREMYWWYGIGRGCSGERWGAWVSRYRLRNKR